jgi:hypothetical protein
MTRFGDEPNGLIRAPNVWQIDFELLKETRLNERFIVEFAVQAFNIFNHTQFADPSNLMLAVNCPGPTVICTTQTDTSNGFGLINTINGHNNNNDSFFNDNVGTGLARQLQFMLRLKF